MPRVTAEQRAEFVRAGRERVADFDFTEINQEGAIVPVGDREEYFPIYYVQPYAGNEVVLGFDVASETKRRNVLEQARDDGRVVASEGIVFLQGGDELALFMALAVYKNEPTSLEERNSQLEGFVVILINLGALVQEAATLTNYRDINFSLIDATGSQNRVLFNQNAGPTPKGGDSFSVSQQLSFTGGRNWLIVAEPTAEFLTDLRSQFPFYSALIGMFITVVIVYSLYAQMRREVIIGEKVARRTFELQEAQVQLEALSKTDALTGLHNRRYFDEMFEREWHVASRHGRPLVVAFLDIDFFKEYNDYYGHVAGDEVLKKFATCLQMHLKRAGDFVARYGGEEFVVLLHSAEGAEEYLKDLITQVEVMCILHERSKVSRFVTVSAGMASVEPNSADDCRALLDQADKALYEAKRRGRNRLVIGSMVGSTRIQARLGQRS